MEEDIEILEKLLEEGFEAMCYPEAQAIEHLIKEYKKLEEENKRLKASHIMTNNKVSDEEKAKIFDVIDNSIDTYFEKSKPYWEQIMTKDEMSLEEAETIINDMYQDRNKILENNNVIDISRLDDVKFTNLEFASVRVIREIQSLKRKLDKSIPVSLVEEEIDKKQKQLELLKKELQGRQTNFVNKNIITGQIQVLQELLEKRK